jgi:GH15 family glucan-1,4-alpha-glucosidase
MLGNGSMLVGLDKHGMVNDFYYPYVGLEDHINARLMHHKIGIWVDDKFSWMDDGSWQISLDYEEDAMISTIKAINNELNIALEFHDFVDPLYNVFCRNIHVVNNDNSSRSVRVFFHQLFQISNSNKGDTALYEPNGNYILDYKGRRSFLIYAQDADGKPFDQYGVGVHGIEGKEGTFKDAEDGELSCNPVEHGMVDSTFRVKLELPALSSQRVHYWVVSAASHHDALKIHKVFLDQGFQSRYQETQKYWHEWLNTGKADMDNIPSKYIVEFKKSLFIMKSHMDRRGSILASGDSEMLNYARDNYSYCWPRDACFVLWPLIRMGYQDEPRAFFEFARDVMTEEGALMHKFQPDRAVGSTWHPLVHNGSPELAIQEDETAIVLFMIHEYFQVSADEDFVHRMYDTLIQPAANFLESFIDKKTKLPHASYDLWEEKFLTSTYTAAITYAGLMSASKIAEHFEYPDDAIRWQTVAQEIQEESQKAFFDKEKQFFIKGFLLDDDGTKSVDSTIDVSSLYGAVMFGLFDVDSDEVKKSVKTLEEQLLNQSPSGGLPRYEYDQYCTPEKDKYKGNPWFVTTLWMAQLYNEFGRSKQAEPLIDWTKSHMMRSSVLSEQIDPQTGEFLSVAPLIWSHAEFTNTILDIYS